MVEGPILTCQLKEKATLPCSEVAAMTRSNKNSINNLRYEFDRNYETWLMLPGEDPERQKLVHINTELLKRIMNGGP